MGLQTAVGIRAWMRRLEVVGRHGLRSPSCAAAGKSLGFRSLSGTQLIELQRVWLKLGVFPVGRKRRGFKPCFCPDLGEKDSTFRI